MYKKTPITEAEYLFANARIEALLPLVSDDTPATDPNAIELKLMSDIAWEYEEEHYPMDIPTPAELIGQAIAERNVTQTEVARMIGVSKSRISDFISGKSVPSLPLAGRICEALHIQPSLMLGVKQ